MSATESPSAVSSQPVSGSPTASPETSPTSSSSTGWLWLLLLALAVLAGVGLVVLGRRRSRAAQWQRSFDAAATRAAWANDTLAPAVLGAPSAAAMGLAWTEASAGFGEVDQTLFALRDSAPDAQRLARLDETRAALATLRSALLDLFEQTSQGASGDVQRQKVAAVEQARAVLRSAVAPPRPG